MIVDGDGTVLTGPLYEGERILFADVDLDRLPTLRRVLDVTGHYSRPDIFHLSVDRTRREAVEYVKSKGSEADADTPLRHGIATVGPSVQLASIAGGASNVCNTTQ